MFPIKNQPFGSNNEVASLSFLKQVASHKGTCYLLRMLSQSREQDSNLRRLLHLYGFADRYLSSRPPRHLFFSGDSRTRTDTPEWLPITGSFQDYCLTIRLSAPDVSLSFQSASHSFSVLAPRDGVMTYLIIEVLRESNSSCGYYATVLPLH